VRCGITASTRTTVHTGSSSSGSCYVQPQAISNFVRCFNYARGTLPTYWHDRRTSSLDDLVTWWQSLLDLAVVLQCKDHGIWLVMVGRVSARAPRLCHNAQSFFNRQDDHTKVWTSYDSELCDQMIPDWMLWSEFLRVLTGCERVTTSTSVTLCDWQPPQISLPTRTAIPSGMVNHTKKFPGTSH